MTQTHIHSQVDEKIAFLLLVLLLFLRAGCVVQVERDLQQVLQEFLAHETNGK